MSDWNGLEQHISVFIGVLLKGTPIRPIISILRNGQDFQVEDQDFRGMAEKIAETEKELSHASNR